jgi:hypothetical protein
MKNLWIAQIQGDEIGRIFAHRVIVYFGKFFRKLLKWPTFLGRFYPEYFVFKLRIRTYVLFAFFAKIFTASLIRHKNAFSLLKRNRFYVFILNGRMDCVICHALKSFCAIGSCNLKFQLRERFLAPNFEVSKI